MILEFQKSKIEKFQNALINITAGKVQIFIEE
jgi:hypothetical protein